MDYMLNILLNYHKKITADIRCQHARKTLAELAVKYIILLFTYLTQTTKGLKAELA